MGMVKVCVRIDAALAARAQRLGERTGKTMSGVVRDALRDACDRDEQRPGAILRAMEAVGFAASWCGPTDLSSDTRAAPVRSTRS